MAAHLKGRGSGDAPAFVPDQDRGVSSGADHEQRLLETRVEAREVREIRAVLAIGVDDDPVELASFCALAQLCEARDIRSAAGSPACVSGIPKSGSSTSSKARRAAEPRHSPGRQAWAPSVPRSMT